MLPLPESLQRAAKQTGGARFFRCAFQVNPAHYSGTFRGQDNRLDERVYVAGLLDKCVALGISVIAVTDHNHAGSVALFKEEAARRRIAVFPGFEVASCEGVHVLCLYAPETTDAEMHRFLGQLDITATEPSSSLSKKPLNELHSYVRTQGGLTIAAHVTQDKGLLTALHGQARVNAWRDPGLLAVQIPGSVDETPEDKRPILKNQNADYRRPSASVGSPGIAIVNAKDVTCADDLDDPSASCFVRMTEITIEGLRQAFLDPASRVRLGSDPLPDAHAEIRGMSWDGGFLDGSGVRFNENLNVLIGGRGTGKSTVIESLRFAFGLRPLADASQSAHDGFVANVLRSGTKVTVAVRVLSPARADYLVERTVPHPPVVKDSQGQVLSVKPLDVMPRFQVFGQHELSELAKDPEKLTRLLDRFVAAPGAGPSQKAALQHSLRDSRAEIMRLLGQLAHHDEQLAALPQLEETQKRFKDAGLEERLKARTQLVKEDQVLKTALSRVEGVRRLADQLRKSLPLDLEFLGAASLDGLPSRTLLEKMEPTFGSLGRTVSDAAALLESSSAACLTEIGTVRDEWESHRRAVEGDYEKTLRELQKERIDGGEFIRVRERLEALRPVAQARLQQQQSLADAQAARRTLVDQWDNLLAEEFRALEKAAKSVTRQLDGRVRVRVRFGAVRDNLFALFKERVGGRLSETYDLLTKRESLSLSDLAQAAREGKNALSARYGLVAAQAERLAAATPDLWMEVEELELRPTTELELNVAADGEPPTWRPLSELSTGQKATAVLMLLLLESDAPLVIDQPEDDLDNRFVTDSVVPRMRQEKRRRQFILATHNANIPVLGDAELIVGLTAQGEAGTGRAVIAEDHLGAIDLAPVRSMVEELLEGGRTAFELRRRKYGF